MSILSTPSSITEIILKFGNHAIYIITINELIAHLSFSSERHLFAVNEIRLHHHTGAIRRGSELNNPACKELKEYLSGNRRNFSIAINPFFIDRASQLRKQIWAAISAIPYGGTASYSEIGRRLGTPALARAVGQAANANPVALIVPCHRVTGKHDLGGYAGGSAIKKKLLELESKNRGEFA